MARSKPATRWRRSRARIVETRKLFLVTDDDGRPLGEVTPDAVIDVLAERDTREARV
ncbi:MAG: hypothetical protein WDN31_18875 [Hyphomicrobium sp.]